MSRISAIVTAKAYLTLKTFPCRHRMENRFWAIPMDQEFDFMWLLWWVGDVVAVGTHLALKTFPRIVDCGDKKNQNFVVVILGENRSLFAVQVKMYTFQRE